MPVIMQLPRLAYDLGEVALVAIILAGMAITVTVRTRSGSALAVFLGLVAVAYVAGIFWNIEAVADPTAYLAHHYLFGGLGPALAIIVDLGLFGIASVAVISAATLMRHWRWLCGIIAALLPMVALALAGRLPTDIFSYVENIVPFSVVLFCPLVVGWAYAISLRRFRSPADSSGL